MNGPALAKDPVCGMSVDPARAKATAEHQGRTYYFCCPGCAGKFTAEPQRYLQSPAGLVSLGAPVAARPPGLVSIGGPKPAPVAAPERDPVCGMMVDPAHAAGKAEYQGKSYYFCNPRCEQRFRAEPEKFLAPKPAPAAAPAAKAGEKQLYICPMDSEVRQPGPGACPKCGMALEPRSIAAAEPENPELRDMARRFWASLALTIPLLVIAMGHMAPGLQHAFPRWMLTWGELALATPVVLWAGWPFFQRAWTSVKNRHANMFTLIGIGVGVAYGYSVVATIAPEIFPEAFREHGIVNVYY